MLKLIRLEMKKSKIRRYIKSAVFCNLGILFFMIVVVFIDKMEGTSIFTDYDEAFLAVDVLVRVTFTIFAAVLMSGLIINEYKNNTISILFTYPISRKKLIISKLLIVVIFTFIFIIVSNIFVNSALLTLNAINNFIPGNLSMTIIKENFIKIVMNALSSSCISLIPLYFGMRKKSASTTIVSSILIALIINGNNYGFSLSSIVAIPITLAVIGVFIAYLSIKDIESKDIIS